MTKETLGGFLIFVGVVGWSPGLQVILLSAIPMLRIICSSFVNFTQKIHYKSIKLSYYF